MNIDYSALFDSCDKLVRRCCKVGGNHHGSAWWADKLIRFFESEDAVDSVVIPVFINAPVMRDGEAVISKDGSLVIRVLDKEV